MSDQANDTTNNATNDVQSVFEAIRHADTGGEYWLARELSQALGYVRWENFASALSRAREACEVAGNQVSDHFHPSMQMIPLAKGVRRLTIFVRPRKWFPWAVARIAA